MRAAGWVGLPVVTDPGASGRVDRAPERPLVTGVGAKTQFPLQPWLGSWYFAGER